MSTLYDSTLFELTDDEKKVLSEKLNVYKNFIDAFGRAGVSASYRLFESFTPREILSKEFEPFFAISTINNEGSSKWIVANILSNSRIFKSIVSTFPENKTDVLIRLLEIDLDANGGNSYSLGLVVNSATKTFNNNNLIDSSCCEDAFIKICEFIKLRNMTLTSCDSLESMLETLISSLPVNDIMKVVNLATEVLPHFKKYPIVILNRNLDVESRSKIIKKSYRQKDLNKYIEILNNNASNLSGIDAFIDATVITNNRVKEKNRGIVEIFRKVFITNQWRQSLYSDKATLDANEVQAFSKKYYKYFLDHSFLLELRYYIGNDTYSSRYSNFIKFFRKIISKGIPDRVLGDVLESIHRGCFESCEFVVLDIIHAMIMDEDRVDLLHKPVEFIIDYAIEHNHVTKLGNYRNIDDILKNPSLAYVTRKFFMNVPAYSKEGDCNLPKSLLWRVRDTLCYEDILNSELIIPELAPMIIQYDELDNFPAYDTEDLICPHEIVLKAALAESVENLSEMNLEKFTERFINVFEDSEIVAAVTENIIKFDQTSNNYIKNCTRWTYHNQVVKKTSERMLKEYELLFDVIELIYPVLINQSPEEYTHERFQNLKEVFEDMLSTMKLFMNI